MRERDPIVKYDSNGFKIKKPILLTSTFRLIKKRVEIILTKDKVIGAVIMVFAIALIFFYTIIGPIDLLLESSVSGNWQWLETATAWFRNIPGMNWKWGLVLPMWLVVFLIGIIAAWIGFSMLTTPPPVPLEELEEELEAEEAEEAEEKSTD